MLIKFMKYIHAEDVQTKDELWSLYQEWMQDGKPAVKRTTKTDSRVKTFVDTMCVVAVDQQISKTELHDMYTIFSDDVRGGSVFARELRALLAGKIADHRPSKEIDGKRLRCWKGIGLKA